MVNYIQAHIHTHMYINIITLKSFKHFVTLTEYITDDMILNVFQRSIFIKRGLYAHSSKGLGKKPIRFVQKIAKSCDC